MRHAAILVALALLPLVPAALAEAELPSGCEPADAALRCRWEFDAPVAQSYWEFEVPVFPRTLVTLTTTLEGRDAGWREFFIREGPGGEREYVSQHPKNADDNPVRPLHRSTSEHLILADAASTYIVGFSNAATTSAGNSQVSGAGVGSQGRFTLMYEAVPLPAGEAPARPAATPDDPHLAAVAGDARAGAYDLVAAWFNDAAMGDGMFDVHVAVANLSDYAWSSEVGQISWNVSWTLGGERYAVVWDLDEDASADAGYSTSCFLTRFRPTGVEFLMTPPCDFDFGTGVLSAVVAERALGSPAPGVAFTDLASAAHTHSPDPVETGFGFASSAEDVRPGLREEDAIVGERYAFALGGPAVWDELNPRLAVAETAASSPLAVLAAGGLPVLVRVLSVVGVIVLAIVILIVRRRQESRRLIEEVDLAVWAHRDDAAQGLLALGRLEDRFDELLRAGSIRERSYRRASAHLAAAATRFAMRRELGLDTGYPGEGRARLRP